jgi:hypothetical protein
MFSFGDTKICVKNLSKERNNNIPYKNARCNRKLKDDLTGNENYISVSHSN